MRSFRHGLRYGSAILAGIVALAAVPAEAQVTYAITGFSDVIDGPQSATFTLPTYLSGDGTIIPLSAFASCASATACTDFQFYADDPFNGFTDYSLLVFNDSNSGTYYYFDKAAFTSNGVFGSTVFFNLATLTVRGIPGEVPEPASWAMMIAGFGMVGGTARYRRRRIVASFG